MFRKPLTLSRAHLGAAPSQHSVVAMGQVHDELGGTGLPCRFDAFSIDPPLTGLVEVIHHRVGEEERLVENRAQLLAEACLDPLGEILTVDENQTRIDVVIAGQDSDAESSSAKVAASGSRGMMIQRRI